VLGDIVAEFTVDTKLFRELGEYLVGRESTALIELIKNAYDADATTVEIFGENLEHAEKGIIVVRDNGIGMTVEEFTAGFLRIAGRSKTTSNRRSPWFRRRYTGEKGIGRLAAHKLARVLRVESWRWDGDERDDVDGFGAATGVKARIDWDAIEALETLAQIARSNAVVVEEAKSRAGARAGTQLRLEKLRHEWTGRNRAQFFQEVATLTPPEPIARPIPEQIVPHKMLFRDPKMRDEQRKGGFEIVFAGELKLSESDLPALVENATWAIEIDCDARSRRLRIAVEPTKKTLEEYATAEGFLLEKEISPDQPMLSFQTRILQRDNAAWPNAYRGVRVYYEGFRVLPYGEGSDDWLDLDRDYRSRGRGELGRLQRFSHWDLPSGHKNESLVQQGNNSVFGGVFLTREGASSLEMLVNREGFLPSPYFNFVVDTVRLGIDLQVRLRYAVSSEVKDARRKHSDRQKSAAR
jgi:hypothetical protein